MLRFAAVYLAVPAVLLCCAPAFAHHSTAEFDYTKTVMLQGVVKEFGWTNPHSYMQLMVPDATGKLQQWAIEYGAPNINARMGWRKDSVKPGMKVQLNIAPARDGRPYGTLRVIQLPDGSQLQGVAARVPVTGVIPPSEQK